MFVTNWISTTKIQKISEITNFFRHYFLSRTEVYFSFKHNICHNILILSAKIQNIPDSPNVFTQNVPDSPNVFTQNIPDSPNVFSQNVPDSPNVFTQNIPDSPNVFTQNIPDSPNVWSKQRKNIQIYQHHYV